MPEQSTFEIAKPLLQIMKYLAIVELVKSIILTLRYTSHTPQQLWSLTALTRRLGLVQSSYEFGHMGTNCDLDPQKVSKFQWCLSYASCDEMIKKGLCNVGLKDA